MFQFAKSLLSHKLRERLRTHSNFDKLAEHVPASILPAEVGGRVPMSEMIDQWKAVLVARRDTILSLDLVEYSIENVMGSSNVPTNLATSTKTTSSTTSNTSGSEVIEVMASVCKIEVSS